MTGKFIGMLFLNIILTMICIYIIKVTVRKYDIPVMNKVIEQV